VGANDQLVFDGHSLFVNEKGDLMQMAKGFVEDDLIVDLNTHACPCVLYRESLNDINSSNLTVRNLQESGIKDLYAALVLGVRDYFHKQGFSKAILGMSGGIDSALVGCIAKDALGEKNVLALALPSRYNSQESLFDAISLCQNINIEFRQISIDSILQNYLDLLEPLFEEGLQGLTKENLQPRIRAMILMSFSNQEGSILLNTSNKSEMAMGYSTLYGDMAGGLGVLQDVLKLQVYQLAEFVNAKQEVIPRKILTKIPSAELRVDQTDFDTLPPYEILDAVIEDYIELSCCSKEIALKRKFSLDLVESIIRKIHLAEYKRRQAPIGIRVSQKAFGKGRIIPIVQKWQSSI